MKIAVIGAGRVGTTLGSALIARGHAVIYGVRDGATERDAAVAAPVAEAVRGSDAVILATPWPAAEAAVKSAGDFDGKPLLDVTNPLGDQLTLTVGLTDSGGELVQRWAPTARVVKVFNTTGMENMANPRYGDHRATMFLCGDDPAARAIAIELARALGFDPIDIGPLQQARLLEPLGRLWIELALVLGHGRDVAFRLMRRGEARAG